ncbi:MAG: choice-of-anchor tandem repeat GloVer-containing protein [Candidatus Korobacteraceae bacterium]
MSSPTQPPISLIRTVVLSVVAALLMTSAALPMSAQATVPPTAVEAARMPQYASRLAHPTPQPISRPKPAPARLGPRTGPPQGGDDLYDNGPINGNVSAWTINSGYIVSDTISVAGGSSVTGMSFGAWLFAGDTLTSVEISITSEPNGGTSYFDQTVNFTQGACTANQYGYNVCTENTTFNGPTLNGGTYWVNLQNANVPSGDPVYWDENSGVGCQGNGCPSQADESSVGTIPSESFTLEGSCYPNCQPVCFEPGGNLQVLYNFTQQQSGTSGPSGVTIDRAGNLYGTTGGGNNGAGFAYKLARFAGWLLDPLFSFFGGNNGGEPTGVIVGPNGSLYGGAQGGIQNCGSGGSQDCGLVFNLTPQPTACATAPCSWNENVPYRFSSDSDGSGTINVSASDQKGNLYGTTSSGGAFDAGTVFELTPSGGSWTKSTLYSFTGGDDGDAPGQVLVGNDGNLYGVANGGMYQNGVVFQLTPSGGRWAESVLHAFQSKEGVDPAYLVQDSAGNLYGIISTNLIDTAFGAIFVLEKTSGWTFSDYFVEHFCSEIGDTGNLSNLAIDAAGNLYGTGGGYGTDRASAFHRSPAGVVCTFSFIFKASYDSNGWHYEDLDGFSNITFPEGGSLALDPSGNLYGTTNGCGTNGYGTVWQLSP